MTQIGSAGDIARTLGVTSDAVHKWVARYDDFPSPVSDSAVGRLYDLAGVSAWAKGRGLPKRHTA